MFWTVEDLNSGLCSVSDLGKQRPEPVAPEAPPLAVIDPDAPPGSARKRLVNDALAAYYELGGVEYLKKNPDLLDKILAKTIAPEPITNTQVNVRIDDMAWVSAQRLTYRLKPASPEEVIEDATPKPAADGAPQALAKPPSAAPIDPIPE